MTNAMKLTKTCLVCGASKQLSAFLQLTSEDGTLYGNVCATCRGADAKHNEQVILTDDVRGSTSAGLRIGADARNQAELDDKKRREEKEELTREENEKREKRLHDKFEKTDLIEKNEKRHRKDYIDFLSAQLPTTQQDKKKQRNQKTFTNKVNPQAVLDEKQTAQLKQERETLAKEDAHMTTLDLSDPTVGLRSHEARYHSAAYQSFKNWLGGSAAVNLANKPNIAKPQEKLQKDAPKETPIEYTNKAWPSGKKR